MNDNIMTPVGGEEYPATNHAGIAAQVCAVNDQYQSLLYVLAFLHKFARTPIGKRRIDQWREIPAAVRDEQREHWQL